MSHTTGLGAVVRARKPLSTPRIDLDDVDTNLELEWGEGSQNICGGDMFRAAKDREGAVQTKCLRAFTITRRARRNHMKAL